MTSLPNSILQRFTNHFPIPTMACVVLERCLNPQQLDAGFGTVAEGQYTRTLLLSTAWIIVPASTPPDPSSLRGVVGSAQSPKFYILGSVNYLKRPVEVLLLQVIAETCGFCQRGSWSSESGPADGAPFTL